MPSKVPNITLSHALHAVHVFSRIATASVTDPVPPFTYGSGKGPHDIPVPNQYPMTPANSLPALVVWLFLVTNPDYHNQLNNPGSGGVLAPELMADLAAATNLDPSEIKKILGIYANAPAIASPHDRGLRVAFNNVAAAFQEYAISADYPDGHCPGDGDALLRLALQGAKVDPSVNDLQ